MKLLLLVLVTLAGLLVASPADADPPPYHPHYTWSQTPSKVWLPRSEGSYLRLRPWSYCWTAPPRGGTDSATCVDGVPPEDGDLPSYTTGATPRMWFGRPGWRFSAQLVSLHTPQDEGCAVGTKVVRKLPHWFRIRRPERPGVYRTTLSGHGPEGDEVLTFRWRVGRYWSSGAC